MDNDFATGYALGADSSNGCNNGNMWGGDGGWWIVIILFAMIFGWGNGGFGGFGGNGNGVQGALTRADLCQDMNFQGLENAVRGVNQGLCDGFYAMNTSMLNGFNGVDNAVCDLGYQNAQLINGVNNTIQQGFNSANVVALQNQNALQTQLSDCCCRTQTNLMQLGNNVERSFCDSNYNQATNTNAIIQNAHNDTDRILSRLDALESARKDETIADLRSKLAACGDQTTAQYIINQLTGVISPRAVPAYPAASPCGLGNWSPNVVSGGWYGNGYNNCGCNSGCCGCNG